MNLVCRRIKPDEIHIGDEITFAYAFPKQHRPERVGVVVDFIGQCVRLWDFSLHDGPDYRSYRLDGLRNLAILEEVTTPPFPQPDLLERYRRILKKITGGFFGATPAD